RDALQPGAARPAHDPEPVVLRHGALEQREGRLEQRHVDDLPPAATGGVVPVERREDPLGGEHPCEGVAERDVEAGRRLTGKAVDVAEPAHRLGHGREARPLGIRAGLAVPGDARQDDPRVHVLHSLEADVPALERAGPEVLRDDVRPADELEQELLAALRSQVQRHALLVTGLDRPPERTSLIARLAPFADGIGPARILDLDDLGAEIAEQPSGERPREQRPELYHPHARERSDPARLLDGCGAPHRLLGPGALNWRPLLDTARSRASKTCSRITSSARSASRTLNAFVICRW